MKPDMKHVLRLYVTGASGAAKQAIANLEALISAEFGDWELEVIDVLEEPDRAEEDKIIATPTLIRRLPTPLRKIVGDLRQTDKLLVALDLEPHGGSQNQEGE